jgi:hypothetical protein
VNPTPYAELRDYPDAPIEIQKIDREILMLLSGGIDVIDMIRDAAKK